MSDDVGDSIASRPEPQFVPDKPILAVLLAREIAEIVLGHSGQASDKLSAICDSHRKPDFPVFGIRDIPLCRFTSAGPIISHSACTALIQNLAFIAALFWTQSIGSNNSQPATLRHTNVNQQSHEEGPTLALRGFYGINARNDQVVDFDDEEPPTAPLATSLTTLPVGFAPTRENNARGNRTER